MAEQAECHEVRATASDERVQPQLDAQTGRTETQKEERPIQWVPGPDLDIRQEREAAEEIGCPERQTSGVDGFGKETLRGVVDLDAVPARGTRGQLRRV